MWAHHEPFPYDSFCGHCHRPLFAGEGSGWWNRERGSMCDDCWAATEVRPATSTVPDGETGGREGLLDRVRRRAARDRS